MNLPKVGDLFHERYRIEQWLGSGGFAHVFRATQIDLGRPVALKLLSPSNASAKESREHQASMEVIAQRFEREARTISQLRSPETVSVYDFGLSEAGFYFMALEFIEGADLHELLTSQRALSPERTVRIIRQVLKSLAEAHLIGVLHRDIKPSNIMLYAHMGEEDLVKVLDFGIAAVLDDGASSVDRLTQTGSLVGTPQYMSPELIQGEAITPSADLYAVGLMMYEMLCGRPAVDRKDGQLFPMLMQQIDPEPFRLPEDASISPALRAIVERMVLKTPEARYQSAQEIIADLDQLTPADLAYDGRSGSTEQGFSAPVVAAASPASQPHLDFPEGTGPMAPVHTPTSLEVGQVPVNVFAETAPHDAVTKAQADDAARAAVRSTGAEATIVTHEAKKKESPATTSFDDFELDLEVPPTTTRNKALVGASAIVFGILIAVFVAMQLMGPNEPPAPPDSTPPVANPAPPVAAPEPDVHEPPIDPAPAPDAQTPEAGAVGDDPAPSEHATADESEASAKDESEERARRARKRRRSNAARKANADESKTDDAGTDDAKANDSEPVEKSETPEGSSKKKGYFMVE